MNKHFNSSAEAPLASLIKKMSTNPPRKVIPLKRKKVPATPKPSMRLPVAMDIKRTHDQRVPLAMENPDSVRITADT